MKSAKHLMPSSSSVSVPGLLVSFLGLLLSSPSEASSYAVYDSFIQCLAHHSASSSIVYTRSNSSYSAVLQSYIRNRRFNTSSTPKPLFILTPTARSHVRAAVLCSKNSSLQMTIRSGGHDFDGLSYVSHSPAPFFVLDMFNLRGIDIRMRDETAWVEAGATLGELYYRIWEKSRVHGFPAGVCPTVAAGGHISGGGYGNMLRKHGLSIDHVVDAKIVDADGRILDRSAMGEDLFWAIRGGGGASFGVVLAYKIKLVPVPETVTVFRVRRTLEQNATGIVHKWQLLGDEIDNDLFIKVQLQPETVNKKRTVRATFVSLFLGDSARLMSVMDRDFPELGLTKDDCSEMSWIESVLYWASFGNGTSPEALLRRIPNAESVKYMKRKSDYVKRAISMEGLEGVWEKMTAEAGAETELVFNLYGGRMGEIPSTETAFPHRGGNKYKIQYSVNWREEGEEAERERMRQIRGLYEYMTPFVSGPPRGSYLNYRDVDIGVAKNWSLHEGQVYGSKYFLHNFDRLVKGLKKADQQSILDDFNKNASGITQPSVTAVQVSQPMPVVPVIPAAPVVPAASPGVIASREDVLT